MPRHCLAVQRIVVGTPRLFETKGAGGYRASAIVEFDPSDFSVILERLD
jgi:hypothetical protein